MSRGFSYQKPENALRRADEFLGLGKDQKALMILYEIIRRRNQQWQKSHEEIMRKYLDLCIKFKDNNLAKDGLHQYKVLCHQINAKSFQDILRGFLNTSEERAEKARQESHQALVDVEDLEAINTAESLLLKAVSSEGAADRADRSILLPWVRFLWESYRQCLDLLRNNKNVEELYHYTALQALKFCQKYERKAEFKKLCDLFRNHLSWTMRMQQHTFSVQLKDIASFDRHVEVRFALLDVAIEMRLWQEAFRGLEDIYNVVAASERQLAPARQAQYYEKAALIFWQSQHFSYHALASQRLYQLTKENKKTLTADELQMLASIVVCSALSVPIVGPSNSLIDAISEPDQREQIQAEKGRIVARLLWCIQQNVPSRQQMVSDLVRRQVLQFAHPNLQPLFNCLEIEFDPYGIVGKMERCLQFLESSDQLRHYTKALHEAAAVRCIQQLAQVYDNVSLESVSSLLSFIDKLKLEHIICNVAKSQNIKVSVDHQRGLVVFRRPGDSVSGNYAVDYLENVAGAVNESLHLLRGQKLADEWLDKMKLYVSVYLQNERERGDDGARKGSVDERLRLNDLRLQLGERRRAELEQAEKEAEFQRQLEADRKQKADDQVRQLRETQRLKDQLAAAQRAEIMKMAGNENGHGADDDDMTTEEMWAKQMEKMKQLYATRLKKLKAFEKKLDYFVRAKRIEEIPLLEKAYSDFLERDPREWQEAQEKLIAAKEAEYNYAIEVKHRLSRMCDDGACFVAQLKEQRAPEYRRAVEEWQRQMNDTREKRLAERKRNRKETRRAEYQAKVEAEAQRRRDAEDAKRRSEEEQQAKQAAEREAAAAASAPGLLRAKQPVPMPAGTAAAAPADGAYIPPSMMRRKLQEAADRERVIGVQAPQAAAAAAPPPVDSMTRDSWRQREPPQMGGGMGGGRDFGGRPPGGGAPPGGMMGGGRDMKDMRDREPLQADKQDVWRRGGPPAGAPAPGPSREQQRPAPYSPSSGPSRGGPPRDSRPPPAQGASQADSASSWRRG